MGLDDTSQLKPNLTMDTYLHIIYTANDQHEGGMSIPNNSPAFSK